MSDRKPRNKTTKYSSGLLERTKQLWVSDKSDPMSDNEAIEIIENITGFFDFLHSLDKKYDSNANEEENLDTHDFVK